MSPTCTIKLIYLFIILFLISCYHGSRVELTFINRMDKPIDSIVIQCNKEVTISNIPANKEHSELIDGINIGYAEGAFQFKVYSGARTFLGLWGVHDYGSMSSYETFYIFKNGISRDNSLIKPKEFKLYFGNGSSSRIDSIYSENEGIVRINESTPRRYEVVYDYNIFESNPEFIVRMDGKVYKDRIVHDFWNWNNPQAFIAFDSNHLSQEMNTWKEPLEFIVDISFTIPVDVNTFSVESKALTKIYRSQQPLSLEIVFDYRKLVENPVFYVSSGSEKRMVAMSNKWLSNKYCTQKIFYWEKGGIQALSD